NYDMGSLYINSKKVWQIVAPTEQGPQEYNPGGEVAVWESTNRGVTWVKIKQLTKNSIQNHTYVRRPINVNPDFYSIWADGHGRQPSKSNLYFSTKDGKTFILPRNSMEDMIMPVQIALE